MSKFIGYTVGLECRIGGKIKMIKCEYCRADGGVMIHAVSGNNLGRIGGRSKIISQVVFDARPVDPYDGTREAIWSLKQIGLTPAAIDEENGK